ncbi:ThiF family adenylyltransferase [Phytomonospora sp. NPDC050363]|uniref:ThiF family adenylyltransferase n=1 Tax=Phytomonospora sp. NPDC050363 TaxID=3155642 RepID=UPI0034042DB6
MELKELARQRPSELRILRQQLDAGGDALFRVGLHTAGIPRTKGGLRIQDDEEFILRLRSSPLLPPTVEVDHFRFLGHPHVLQGIRLCIYLDPSREWQPWLGIAGLLTRLWDWLTDAAGGNFDASTAMYHAVGGVLHQTAGTPTIVVRDAGPLKRYQAITLVARSDHRFDLTWSKAALGHHTFAFTLEGDLPLGAATTFAVFLSRLDGPEQDGLGAGAARVSMPSQAFLTMLLASALRNPEGSEQYFVVAVPHPVGGPAHLLGGRLPSSTADDLRRLAREQGTGVDLAPAKIKTEILIEWCSMSDERQEVTTRRDDRRPVNGFLGKKVHVWGCGGLGSWIAEFIARAGATEITVCDPGTITGGLLVRQNYVEDDIGLPKADALAARLRSISDDLTVAVASGSIPDAPKTFLATDLIVDATVSNSIAMYLDAFADEPQRRAVIAQVSTDSDSGTLGIVNLCALDTKLVPSEIDQGAGQAILGNSKLELYHPLWQEPTDSAELVPTRGCSVPTFHGSAADLAAVAATLVSLMGSHLHPAQSIISGTHLIALPHAAHGPRHYFHPADAGGSE